jgi:hypothetical protein
MTGDASPRLDMEVVHCPLCGPYESLLHNLESDLKTHVSVDPVVRKC